MDIELINCFSLPPSLPPFLLPSSLTSSLPFFPPTSSRQNILPQVPDSTITIWSAESDPFDPVTLVTLRDLLGAEAVYIDLPPSLLTQYKEVTAANMARKGGEGGASYLPTTASVLATVGMGLASALAALYLYE